jgi:tryptophan-rich sensory protein
MTSLISDGAAAIFWPKRAKINAIYVGRRQFLSPRTNRSGGNAHTRTRAMPTFDALATIDWAVSALLVLPVAYAVVATHRERTARWWNELSRPVSLSLTPLLVVSWLVYAASGGPAVATLSAAPLATHTALAFGAARVQFALTALAWPLLLFIAHGKGYALIVGLGGLVAAVIAEVILIANADVVGVWCAVLYAVTAAWSLYIFVLSVIVWTLNRIGPTPRRPTTHSSSLSAAAALAPPPPPLRVPTTSSSMTDARPIEIVVDGGTPLAASAAAAAPEVPPRPPPSTTQPLPMPIYETAPPPAFTRSRGRVRMDNTNV